MDARYRNLTTYSFTLALMAFVWLGRELTQVADFPPLWIAALCVVACLFVFQFGVRAPRIGLISMERVPQFALLLTLSAPVAAAICALASLLWPLLNRRYSQGSVRVAALRGVHNAAMTALMLLLAGMVFTALGGQRPLQGLSLSQLLPLLAMALTAQAVNIALMMLFFRFDGRDVRRIFTPIYVLSDLIFVPAGILTALLATANQPAMFALFVGLMGVFVLSFNAIGQSSSNAQPDRAPLARLFQTRRALHGARSIDSLGERVATEMHTLFRFDEFYLALANRDQQSLELRVHERRGVRMPARTKPLSTGLFGHVISTGESVLVANWSQAPETLRHHAEVTTKETGSLIVVPLLEHGTPIGLLSVQHTNTGLYAQADLHLLERLAEEVSVAVTDARAFEDAEEYRQRLEQRVAERTEALEQANREKELLLVALRERSQTFERESQEDPLTGIANRRWFLQRLSAELEVARAVGQPLSLAIADMDFFKAINDRLGHRVGDEALRQSAVVIRGLCRASQMVGRIGGEEFAWLMPDTDHANAFELCEAARTQIESHDWSNVHPELRPTISIGLSEWDGSASIAELLHAADLRLYEAKHSGRNRVA